MYKYKSDFLMFLNERGYLHQVSDSENLDKAFLKKNITAYIGFDLSLIHI